MLTIFFTSPTGLPPPSLSPAQKLWIKTNHYPNKITFHLVTVVPMTSFTIKSTSKFFQRSFLHFRYSIVIPRFIPHANKAQL